MMIIGLKQFGYLLAISFVVGIFVNMMNNAFAHKAEEQLAWEIQTTKEEFYPGEPVLLTLKIKNTSTQQEKVDFGTHGIEAFSMELHDSSGKALAKRGKIHRYGVGRLGTVPVAPGQVGIYSIVFNQWCSTLLPSGKYHLVCNIEYRLRSEATKIPGTEVFKSGPLHTTKLVLYINIIKMDISKLKKILEQLSIKAFKTKVKTKRELEDQRIARETLAFAESDLAVAYQLQILRTGASTWLKQDAINSLVRSGTVDSAKGLIQIISENEDCIGCIEDIKQQVVDAVYKLRETGRADIIAATDDFVMKYKRSNG